MKRRLTLPPVPPDDSGFTSAAKRLCSTQSGITDNNNDKDESENTTHRNAEANSNGDEASINACHELDRSSTSLLLANLSEADLCIDDEDLFGDAAWSQPDPTSRTSTVVSPPPVVVGSSGTSITHSKSVEFNDSHWHDDSIDFEFVNDVNHNELDDTTLSTSRLAQAASTSNRSLSLWQLSTSSSLSYAPRVVDSTTTTTSTSTSTTTTTTVPSPSTSSKSNLYRRIIPSHKYVKDTSVMVDAFQYVNPACSQYFLSYVMPTSSTVYNYDCIGDSVQRATTATSMPTITRV
jgi:hypothetical protein